MERAADARWSSRVGAWLGIGTSPAALVLGVGLAQRHGGAVPIAGLLAGALTMSVLLYVQGRHGLRPPAGEGATTARLFERYLGGPSRIGVNLLLAAAMAGWFGFTVGLGGGALNALLGLPSPAGQLLLGIPITIGSFGGVTRWNRAAVLTTASALTLVTIIVILLAPRVSPVTATVASASLTFGDIASFVGYVAVFSVRSPDFTTGLERRTDLLWCMGLLVVPMVGVCLAGVGLRLGIARGDLVAALASPDGLPLGNLLVAVAVIAPSFTNTHSGSLSLRAVFPVGVRTAVLMISAPGLALAAIRFDLWLLPWLRVLAAVMPPLIVPLFVEARRHRRGMAVRVIPWWTWMPASLIAVMLTAAGLAVAPVAGLGTAVVLVLARAAAGPVGRRQAPRG